MNTTNQKAHHDVAEVVVDMSPAAIDDRLCTVERLRRLCVSLAEAGRDFTANAARVDLAR